MPAMAGFLGVSTGASAADVAGGVAKSAELPAVGKATTTANFSGPGDYTLLVVINDWREFLCCWTNGLVQVKVQAAR